MRLKGREKLTPSKKLERNPTFQNEFRQFGESRSISDKLLSVLESFVCVMYGYPCMQSIDTVDTVQTKMLRKNGWGQQNHRLQVYSGP